MNTTCKPVCDSGGNPLATIDFQPQLLAPSSSCPCGCGRVASLPRVGGLTFTEWLAVNRPEHCDAE